MNYETLHEVVHIRAKTNPKDTFMVFFEENKSPLEITNKQLQQDVEKYASFFIEHCKVNSVVLLALEHNPFLPIAFLACMSAGVIPCIVPYLSEKTSLESHIKKVLLMHEQVSAQAIVTLPKHGSFLAKHTKAPVFTVETIAKQETLKLSHFPLRKRNDPAFLQFSSGTTGQPKAILFSHDSVLNNLSSAAIATQINIDDVTVSWGPFYHDLGLILGLLLPLVTGGKTILISPFHWIREPEILFYAISQYRGTVSWMPNFGFDVCTQRIDVTKIEKCNIKSLRFIGCGAEPTKEATLLRFCARFANFGFRRDMILPGYGLAENVVMVTATKLQTVPKIDWVSSSSLQKEKVAKTVNPQQQDAISFVSCGKAIPHNKLKIVNEKGNSLPSRCVGEILIKSNSLLKRYYNNSDLTKQILQDGWLYTGDIGYIADDELYVCGRKKNIIIVGGQNIYPDHIENIAQEILQENGARVAACGMYDEKMGTETILLVCELRKTETDDLQSISHQIRTKILEEIGVSLAHIHFVPKGWIIKTTSGKLARQATCEKYLQETKTDQSTKSTTSLLEIVQKLFRQHAGISPQINDNFWHLSLDSIIFLRIFISLEETLQRSLPLPKILENPTITNLLKIVEETTYSDKEQNDAVQERSAEEKPQTNRTSFLKRSIASFLKNGPIWRQTSLVKYQTGMRILRIWLSLPQVCPYFYGKQISLLQRCKKLIGQAPPEFIRQHLLVNSWQKWQNVASQIDKRYCIASLETIQLHLDQGKGIILLGNHSPLIRIFCMHLRMHYSNYFEIGGIRQKQNKSQRQAFLTHQLYQAQQILKQGGIVFLMADGLQGKQTFFPFFSKKRPFSSGFVFLASTTNAHVLPVFAHSLKKRFEVKILPSINNQDISEKELLAEYVKVFSEYWKKNWHLMATRHLYLFCNYPEHSDSLPIDTNLL